MARAAAVASSGSGSPLGRKGDTQERWSHWIWRLRSRFKCRLVKVLEALDGTLGRLDDFVL